MIVLALSSASPCPRLCCARMVVLCAKDGKVNNLPVDVEISESPMGFNVFLLEMFEPPLRNPENSLERVFF